MLFGFKHRTLNQLKNEKRAVNNLLIVICLAKIKFDLCSKEGFLLRYHF